MTALRDTTGRYQSGPGRPCVCGHTAGQHTADRYRNGEYIAQPCCEDCSCQVFTRAKGRK